MSYVVAVTSWLMSMFIVQNSRYKFIYNCCNDNVKLGTNNLQSKSLMKDMYVGLCMRRFEDLINVPSSL